MSKSFSSSDNKIFATNLFEKLPSAMYGTYTY